MLQNTTQCIPVHFTILQEQKKRPKRKRKGLCQDRIQMLSVHYLASLNILLLCSDGPAYRTITHHLHLSHLFGIRPFCKHQPSQTQSNAAYETGPI